MAETFYVPGGESYHYVNRMSWSMMDELFRMRLCQPSSKRCKSGARVAMHYFHRVKFATFILQLTPMSKSNENGNFEPLAEGSDNAFEATMLNAIDFLVDTNMGDEDDDVSEEDKHEGNCSANEAPMTEVNLSMSIAAIRQRESRESKKQLAQSYYDRVKELDMFVAYFNAKEAQKERIDPYRVAVRAASAHILKTERINLELMTRLEGRIQLKNFLQDWLKSQAPQKVLASLNTIIFKRV
ncbi:hypothetical protein LEN26_013227 [Aphanomyces euteiches]|nr:hypothetical protein LEN26_013227 [Aphanomyces euteiches]